MNTVKGLLKTAPFRLSINLNLLQNGVEGAPLSALRLIFKSSAFEPPDNIERRCRHECLLVSAQSVARCHALCAHKGIENFSILKLKDFFDNLEGLQKQPLCYYCSLGANPALRLSAFDTASAAKYAATTLIISFTRYGTDTCRKLVNRSLPEISEY